MAAATKLTFTTQPTNNFAVLPVVTAQDSASATDATFSGAISIQATAGTGSPGAYLTGPITLFAVAGVATWASPAAVVAMNQIGTGFTLTATAGQLTAGTSSTFNVTTVADQDTYLKVIQSARRKCGLAIDGSDESAALLLQWPGAISEARNELANELSIASGPVGADEVQIATTGNREYDLSRYGFIHIDDVQYGTATARYRLAVYERQQALGMTGGNPDTTTTGQPAGYYWDGGDTLGLVPVPTTATSFVWVSGTRVRADLSASTDRTGLSQMCNEAIAYGAAKRIAGEYDPERPDHQLRVARLEAGYDRQKRQIITLTRRMVPQEGGYGLVRAAADAMRIYEQRGRRV